MKKYATFVLCFIFVSAEISASKQFRDDYEYSSKTDAFYKLHHGNVNARRAGEICRTEGSHLMSPAKKEDLVKLHAMLKSFPDIGDLVWVDYDGEQHESAEEVPLIDLSIHEYEDESTTVASTKSCDVVTRYKGRIETSPCLHKHPFICKIKAEDVQYDSQCGLYVPGYHYISAVGSCYRVPPSTATWNVAYADCRAEGAHLVIINSDAERLAIKELLRPFASIFRSFYVGIRANRHTDDSARVFRTVFNNTLEEAGYSGWAVSQPNNCQKSQDCVVVFRYTGTYNDVKCTRLFGFICEKEVVRDGAQSTLN